MCYLVRSEPQRGGLRWAWQKGLLGLQEKNRVSWAREPAQTKEQSHAWSCVAMAQACGGGIHGKSQNREEPSMLGTELGHYRFICSLAGLFDSCCCRSPWRWRRAAMRYARAAAGVSNFSEMRCCCRHGMRRLLRVAPLWHSALCVSRFSFPALRHIKALQSRHRTHIVTSLASQRMLF